MVKYKAHLEDGKLLTEKVNIDSEAEKSVMIDGVRHSKESGNTGYFDSKREAKIFLNKRYTFSLKNSFNKFIIVKNKGCCGFELYDNEYKKMKPCGIKGNVVTKHKHLCTNHFKSVIGSKKAWSMFNLDESPIITINKFLEELERVENGD